MIILQGTFYLADIYYRRIVQVNLGGWMSGNVSVS